MITYAKGASLYELRVLLFKCTILDNHIKVIILNINNSAIMNCMGKYYFVVLRTDDKS
jgi:hypothetical protein